jgi:hypothetical protein
MEGNIAPGFGQGLRIVHPESTDNCLNSSASPSPEADIIRSPGKSLLGNRQVLISERNKKIGKSQLKVNSRSYPGKRYRNFPEKTVDKGKKTLTVFSKYSKQLFES